jgi:hypothetical protein
MVLHQPNPVRIPPFHPTNTQLTPSSTYLDGTPRPLTPLGPYPVGLIIYSHSDYMSANIWSTDPGAIPAPADNQTDSELSLIGRHTLSYAGGLQL